MDFFSDDHAWNVCRNIVNRLHFRSLQTCIEVSVGVFSDSDMGSLIRFEEVLGSHDVSPVSAKVLRYKKSFMNLTEVEKLWEKQRIFSTDSEEDVVLEVWEEGETVGSFPPQDIGGDYFYFYFGPLKDFQVQFSFSDFVSDLLATLNVALAQLPANRWGFIHAFEFVCESLDIDPILGIFLSLFELKGVGRGNWVS